MAYTFSVNNTPSTGAAAMWLLIQTLVSAGWVVKSDSDGTTYATAGGQVTGNGAGANGLNNTNAWIRIQAPAVNQGSVANQRREITIQRGNTALKWRIKYSASANFTGGLPSASATGNASDEVVMIGTGTDAAPTATTWFNNDGTYRWHICCGGATEFYSFYAIGNINTVTTTANGIFLDAVQAGSFSTLDVDPAVMYCSSAAGFGNEFGQLSTFAQLSSDTIANTTDPARARAWLGPVSAAVNLTAGTNNQEVCLQPYGGGWTAGVPVFGGDTVGSVNPWTGNDDALPAYWGRAGNSFPPNGLKGKSTLFLFGSVKRINYDTGTASTLRDKIHNSAGGVAAASHSLWMPWSGAVVTL